MNPVGSAVVIQKASDGQWLVQMDHVATIAAGESVSLTVAIPADKDATLLQVQTRATERAIELLRQCLTSQPCP